MKDVNLGGRRWTSKWQGRARAEHAGGTREKATTRKRSKATHRAQLEPYNLQAQRQE